MDLRKRLARLDRSTRGPAGVEPERPGPAAVRGGAATDGELRRVLAEDLGLQPAEGPSGTYWHRETVHPEAPQPVASVPDVAGILPAGTPPGLTWDQVLFLDTETTGLAGGTGTLPFLIGLAWWADDGLRVRQLFLSGPGREPPLLAELGELADRYRVVVTYNGASFDLPLLRTRALLARADDPCAHLVGWDLLTASRRLWGRHLPDCRQQTIEAMLRGGDRGPGDIDGALIPAAYLAFVRGGTAGLLPEVLRHNRRDMTGMARIVTAVTNEATAMSVGPAHWRGRWPEAWRRALIGERRRETVAAAGWAEHLAGPDVAPDLPLRAVLDAVRLLKRIAAWDAVDRLLTHGLRSWPAEHRLHYEAAVLHEHRFGDPARALVHAEVLGDPVRLDRLRRRLDQA